jgi:cell cycle checkpoint protein
MDSSLQDLWHTTSATPFLPTVGKGSQFFVGFTLLLLGLFLTIVFTLSEHPPTHGATHLQSQSDKSLDRSLFNIPLLGVPASLAIAYVPSSPRKITH